MELIDYYRTIRLLREKNENKKLILFVGSGVSKNVENMPSWKDLIVEMAAFAGYSKCDTCKLKQKNCSTTCKIKMDFSPDEYLKIPQYAYNQNSEEYSKIINKCFPRVNVDAPLSQVIFDICPDHIITTNYDNLLESSTNIYRDQYDLIIKDEDLLSAQKSKYIIKMHGDLEDPATIVLKESDYLDYSQNHILIETFVKALLTDHILLFLGYSVSDYNIKLIISWINFLRSQKGEAQSNSIGYLVLDKKKISDLEIEYFKKNGIEIVNINQIPMIKNIPSSVKYDEGKRLYSFLTYIKNSSLDTIVDANSHFRHITTLAKNHNVTNLEVLLKLLLVQGYKTLSSLTLYDEGQYMQLSKFLNSQAEEVRDLKQLFVDCGIYYITYQPMDIKKKVPKPIFMGKDINNQLFQDRLFVLYAENRYVELKDQTEKSNTLANFFYNTLIFSPRFRDDNAHAFFAKISIESLTDSEKASYFYNQDLLSYFNNGTGHSLRNFLSSIESKSLDLIYKPYKDWTDRNCSDLNDMRKNLETLQSTYSHNSNYSIFGGDTLRELYKIQNFALQEFFFYFRNHLFFNSNSTLHQYLHLYIEAMFCTNEEHEITQSQWGIPSYKTPYTLTSLDFCVITKFTTPKTLDTLIKKYNVAKLPTNENGIKFVVKSFENLVETILSDTITNIDILSVLMNYAKIIPLIEISSSDRKKMRNSVEKLLCCDKLIDQICSPILPDAAYSMQIFTNFISYIEIKNGIPLIENILHCRLFDELYDNRGAYAIKKLFHALLSTTPRMEQQLFSIIISSKDIKHQIQNIFFFGDKIATVKNLSIIKEILNANLESIPRDLLYEFIWNKFVIYKKEDAEKAIDAFIKLDQKSSPSRISIPDPIYSELEFICLMKITGVVTDLSRLATIAPKYPTLHFLIDPDQFDYTQVDLSNYMWENFARQADLRQKLIEHKSEIIPKIKKRLKTSEASEFEKKILYHYFLQDDEIWSI